MNKRVQLVQKLPKLDFQLLSKGKKNTCDVDNLLTLKEVTVLSALKEQN